MKKVILTIILTTILGLIGIFIRGIVLNSNERRILEDKIENLPVFTFRTLNDEVFNSEKINIGPVLIIFFNPGCEHCQYMIRDFFTKSSRLNDAKIILVSSSSKEEVQCFVNKMSLSGISSLYIMIDDSDQFIKIFGTEVVPSTFIYDKYLRLVKQYKGEVRSESIMKYL